MTSTLVVDGANVSAAGPDGWWKDRAGAARRLHEALLVADTSYDEVVLVLEGAAKGGVRGRAATDTCASCTRRASGDDTIVAAGPGGGRAGRPGRGRHRRPDAPGPGAGCRARSALRPSWLLDQLRLTGPR